MSGKKKDWRKDLLDRSIDASSGLMFRGIGGTAGAVMLETMFRIVPDPYGKVLDWAGVAFGCLSMFAAAIGVFRGTPD